MCGIIGSYGQTQAPLNTRLELLTHRGPNHIDVAQLHQITLGHTRLAIVDVEAGQQPLQSPDGRYWLISNGEIYNHRAIRDQFPEYPFQTQSDSEVIIPLYIRYGKDAVHHLDGMFAFALYDTHTDVLYMARDPLGIKPLYYGYKGDTLYFASEIKALQNLADNLQEFQPGTRFYDGEFSRYYDLHHYKRVALQSTSHPSLEEIRSSLEKAVEKRLMSDVPLGVYLSGGLDSTIIAAIVAQRHPGVHSFAVGVEDSTDLANARHAAEYLGTQHHEAIYTVEDMLEALPHVIYHLESFDPLLVRSAIPNFFLARLTREYVTVVLTGEGADELYAGYHYLKEIDDEQALTEELVTLTETLYNCNLQRCDRMTMAHSIEARVPFLDVDFIELSLKVPKHDKIHPETQTEKWALRQAFSDILPDQVAWRRKEQFSKGAGSSHMLEAIAEQRISDTEFAEKAASIKASTGLTITSKEMLLYYNEFERFFEAQSVPLVALWRGRDV